MEHHGHISKKRELLDFHTNNHSQSGWPLEYHDIGILELLENDQRPTFLLDLRVCGPAESNTHILQ
jgi:hypothetical protein